MTPATYPSRFRDSWKMQIYRGKCSKTPRYSPASLMHVYGADMKIIQDV